MVKKLGLAKRNTSINRPLKVNITVESPGICSGQKTYYFCFIHNHLFMSFFEPPAKSRSLVIFWSIGSILSTRTARDSMPIYVEMSRN